MYKQWSFMCNKIKFNKFNLSKAKISLFFPGFAFLCAFFAGPDIFLNFLSKSIGKPGTTIPGDALPFRKTIF